MRLTICCALLAASALMAGCGSDTPFELVPVHGKVTYEDGSLIKADSLEITFHPSTAAPGPIVPPGGRAQVNVSDGTFVSVTSRRRDDGVAMGTHKVVVIPFKKNSKGNPEPINSVPKQYQRPATTPVQVEIVEAEQFVEIKVGKP